MDSELSYIKYFKILKFTVTTKNSNIEDFGNNIFPLKNSSIGYFQWRDNFSGAFREQNLNFLLYSTWINLLLIW